MTADPTTRGMLMKLRLLLPILAATLACTACFRIELSIDVADDGSVEIDGLSAVDPERFGDVGSFLGEGDAADALDASRDVICDDFRSDNGFEELEASGLDISSEDYDEDGFCGTRFHATGTPEQAATLFSSTSDGLAGEAILREEPDGGWRFELPTDDGSGGTDLEAFPGAEALLGEFSYVIRVRLPGRQVEHNATRIEGDGTMVWDLDITALPDRLFARTEPGTPITGSSGGSGSLPLVLVGVLVAVLAVAAVVLLRRRGRTDASPADAAESPWAGGSATTPMSAPSTTRAADGAPVADPSPFGRAPEPGSSFGPPTGPTPSSPDQGATTAEMPAVPMPLDPTTPAGGDPLASSDPGPATPPTQAPDVIASPTPEQATGAPVWDPVRRAYVQWDPGAARWLVFDEAAGEWRPEA